MRKKMQKLFSSVMNSIELTKCFGLKMGLLDFKSDVILRARGNIGRKADYAKHEYVKQIIRNKYRDNIERCKYKFNTWRDYNIAENAPIWVLWWQGIDVAPEIVKLCINSIKVNCGNHPVHILDKTNFKEYISISEVIQKKLKDGKISITHFSDILRMSILYEKGGIWIDSTVLLQRSIDELQISAKSFFTIKHGFGEQYHVCMGLWSTFFLACTPRHPLLGGIRDILVSYAEQEEIFICYLFIDCVIAVLYEDILEVKKIIDTVPKANGNVFELERVLSTVYNEDVYKSCYAKICVNKLSYRKKILQEVGNKKTIYGFLCSMYSN